MSKKLRIEFGQEERTSSLEHYLKQIREATDWLEFKTLTKPQIAIVLGSGLTNLVSQISVEHEVDYKDIPHFPEATVKGHGGKLIFGMLNKKKVVVMSGRFHFYEGYSMKEVTFPIRVLKNLGCETIIITNASGGLNPKIKVGELCVVRDHINLQPDNPLIGKNAEELGPRFPDQHAVYDKAMIDAAMKIAEKNKIVCHSGVYVSVLGPTFETPAEYRYMHLIGGDCVGMSTVPEVIVANHAGMKIFCISVICDEGNPKVAVKISHDEVVKAAQDAEPKMSLIIAELIAGLK